MDFREVRRLHERVRNLEKQFTNSYTYAASRNLQDAKRQLQGAIRRYLDDHFDES